MKLTYYGHSCFLVETSNRRLLFDPFITPNDLASHIDIRKISADFILVSHGHADHVADLIPIAQATEAVVVCNWEIHEWLSNQGLNDTHPMNIGGKWNFGDITVKCVVAHHSSVLPDGSYGGNAMGFIVTSGEGSFYYGGDTALTLDMQLIPRWAKLRFAALPIGDNFTMDVADAIECARMIQCKTVVGVHYDTFGYIKIDHEAAVQAFNEAGIKLHLVKIGDTVDV